MTPDRLERSLRGTRKHVMGAVRRYHSLRVTGIPITESGPVLFVSNHGFGSIFDLNVVTALAALEDLAPDRPVTVLVHQVAWTVGLGPLMERLDAQPASRESAQAAFEAGHDLLVFPGGDVDAFKPHHQRNRIDFCGRSGFACVAMEAAVPVVPIVTYGTGNTIYALPGGPRIARGLRLDKLLRLKSLPISVSLPWGLNVGLVGFLPYLPLPVALHTKVLPPMRAEPGEQAEQFASRIEAAMQATLHRLSQTV